MVRAVSAWVPVVGTIGGALAGVVAGGLVTWFVEKERWKREDRTRWHPDRRQVYVRLLQLADAYSVAGTHFAGAVAILFASQAAQIDHQPRRPSDQELHKKRKSAELCSDHYAESRSKKDLSSAVAAAGRRRFAATTTPCSHRVRWSGGVA